MKPFVIWFEHRSGSSHLVSLLNSHREIKCRGEMFDGIQVCRVDELRDPEFAEQPLHIFAEMGYRRVIHEHEETRHDPQPEQCEQALASWFNDAQFITGFKFKHPKQPQLFPEIDRQLRKLAGEVKMIVLRRRNLVRRAISHFNMKRVRDISGGANLRGQVEGELQPIELDLDEFIVHVRKIASQQSAFLAWADGFDHVLQLDYEDLLTGEQTEIALQKFIGVREIRKLRSRVVKITPVKFQDAIANYDVFRDRLIQEGYEHDLD